MIELQTKTEVGWAVLVLMKPRGPLVCSPGGKVRGVCRGAVSGCSHPGGGAAVASFCIRWPIIS